MNLNKKAFSLIEIMVWILIVSIVIISWFEAYSKIWIWKINLIEKTNMQKDSFYFSEKLFQIVKEGWTIDYEEYFNRSVLWTTFWSWHYSTPSWYWNFWRTGVIWSATYWDSFYQCRSWDWLVNKLGTSWCYTNTLNSYWALVTWQQRYGQYSFQFIDYNSNYDDDLWDEDWDGNIIWDDDDENLWLWPIPFTSWSDVKELYLISWDKKNRTFVRWNVIRDDKAPTSQTCSINWTNVITWDWCRWTIEFIKLEWVDWWSDHNISTTDANFTQNDWIIDTWLIDRQFTGGTDIIAWSDSTNYWKPLFPTSINVTDFKVYPFPNVEEKYFWKDTSTSSNISPYVILNFKIKPSWETRLKLKNNWREITFNTTINLTDVFSK